MEENIKTITNKSIRIAIIGCDSENVLKSLQHHYSGHEVSFSVPMDADLIISIGRETISESKPAPYIFVEKSDSTEVAISLISEMLRAIEMNFSVSDYIQIREHQIPFENIIRHIQYFQSGIDHVKLERPASCGDGLVCLDSEQQKNYAHFFDKARHTIKCTKFVPASGAASRMFKFLNEFLSDFDTENESINSYINRKNASQLAVFLAGLEKFPFYGNLISELQEGNPDFNTWPRTKRNYHFIKMLLQGDDFNFSSKPKGVLPFHKYDKHVATPIEEHLKEATQYACSDSSINLHFTVTEEHQPLFEEILTNLDTSSISGYHTNVTYSYQDKSTDTIAVTPKNIPFRENGKLVFRPGGHGALIQNLNALDSDLLFIKNIDNVVHDDVETIGFYKKVLGGVLCEIQQKVFAILSEVTTHTISSQRLQEIASFMGSQLNIPVDDSFTEMPGSAQMDFILNALNRPIRVCGMVKNEGEPGGGPFWVSGANGTSLQIVESSQVDLQNNEQRAILESAKYFNPVDIVCGIKRFNGEKFDLNEFVDHEAGFIVSKTKGGRDIKAYELPGLWNGGMAKWITIFVEVPLSTFNPVKTVNDLLKPAHQPS